MLPGVGPSAAGIVTGSKAPLVDGVASGTVVSSGSV